MATELPSNPRGIPRAPFVDVVEKFVDGDSIEPVMRKFNETLWTYKRMELNVLQRRRNLEAKIPELRKALQAVQFLLKKKDEGLDEPLETRFELNDTVYAFAEIKELDKANVMLEYSLAEAETLLGDKLKLAEKSLETVVEDVDYLREQITTMEVNIARVYNWDVKKQRLAKEATAQA